MFDEMNLANLDQVGLLAAPVRHAPRIDPCSYPRRLRQRVRPRQAACAPWRNDQDRAAPSLDIGDALRAPRQ